MVPSFLVPDKTLGSILGFTLDISLNLINLPYFKCNVPEQAHCLFDAQSCLLTKYSYVTNPSYVCRSNRLRFDVSVGGDLP